MLNNTINITTLQDIAAALYDGGWRAEDREDLVHEYDFTDEEVNVICDSLKEYEEAEEKEEDYIAEWAAFYNRK